MDSVMTNLNLISIKAVMKKTNMSKTSVYAYMKSRGFPAPVKIGKSSNWVEHEVDSWIGKIMEQRKAS